MNSPPGPVQSVFHRLALPASIQSQHPHEKNILRYAITKHQSSATTPSRHLTGITTDANALLEDTG